MRFRAPSTWAALCDPRSCVRPSSASRRKQAWPAPTRNAIMVERMSEDPGLGELQDTMIRDIVDRQRAAGLDVVTDGEFRRMFFTGSFDTAVEGFVKSTRDDHDDGS